MAGEIGLMISRLFSFDMALNFHMTAVTELQRAHIAIATRCGDHEIVLIPHTL